MIHYINSDGSLAMYEQNKMFFSNCWCYANGKSPSDGWYWVDENGHITEAHKETVPKPAKMTAMLLE